FTNELTTTENYTLSLHDALPISWMRIASPNSNGANYLEGIAVSSSDDAWAVGYHGRAKYAKFRTLIEHWDGSVWTILPSPRISRDRKSTRLNSSHVAISYAVFCL